MGAYLVKPVTDKVSTDESNETLMYGASSMQGWRVYQEDAHNTILDFDKNCSLFAVYDGHGGHEVATYTAAELPQFITETESFKREEFTQALSDAFLEFDATLVQPEVLMVLKDLAGAKDQDDSDYDGEEVDHLCREAAMPLEEVMAKYCEEKQQFQSPHIRPKKRVGCSSTSDESCSSADESFEAVNSEAEGGKGGLAACPDRAEPQESTPAALSNGVPTEGGVPPPKAEAPPKAVNGETAERARMNGDIKDEGGGDEGTAAPARQTPKDANGDGATPPAAKGKGKAKGKSILSQAMAQAMRVVLRKDGKRKAAQKAERIYQQLQCIDDSTDEEEDDDNFEGVEKSQGPDDEDDSSSSDDADEEEDSDDDAEEANDADDDNQYHEFSMNMREEPGYDSGCTACVALVKGSQLVVANVGDSRCVVSRDGKAFDMSLDHKPEDEPEANRITKAGGRITSDGRVNGGLNLSRALGDHSYKQNKSQIAAEQMISPMPDLRSLSLTPTDAFLVIACDGIWNSMSSQEVCDFVATRIESAANLSTIAEEMFDHCLSPDAHGDGTGCDNMTCIIVKLHPGPGPESGKRACEESEQDAADGDTQKRFRLEAPQ